MLGVLNFHFGVTTGEDFDIDEDLLFESFDNMVVEEFIELLLLGMLLSRISLILDEHMLELDDLDE